MRTEYGAPAAFSSSTSPPTGTVRVARDGVEALSGWTVESSTGVVTFVIAPSAGVLVTHLARWSSRDQRPEPAPLLTARPPGVQVGASQFFQSAPSRASVSPQTSLIRMLRRPVEFAQYLSIRYTERLAEAGMVPSVGSVGDSYDDALAETVIGLFKTEVIRRLRPAQP